MKRLLLYLILIPLLSSAQTSSISGNAYWHYNDYVGDKADAGSDVYLFTGEPGKAPQNTQCDVMGNFRFDNLTAGDYMVLIISKNTTDDGSYNFIPFDAYHQYCKKFLGFDIREQKAAYDSVAILDTAYQQSARQKISLWNSNKRLKDLQIKKDALAFQKRQILSTAVSNVDLMVAPPLIPLRSTAIQKKVNLSFVTLSGGQNKTIIADFGITYR
jgi:hypothetical protein